MKVTLPDKFAISNIRNLSHNSTPHARRDGGFKRVLSQGPRSLCGLRNSKPRGIVDLIDDEGKMHQLRILLQPQSPQVYNVIELCRAVIASTRGGEGILVAWWNVMHWLRTESINTSDMEWTALVITLFSMVFGINNTSKPNQSRGHSKRKSRTGPLRSSSGANSDLESWEIMQNDETSGGNVLPSWANNRGWQWLEKDGGVDLGTRRASGGPSLFSRDTLETCNFIQRHVKLTRDFIATTIGQSIMFGCLPTSGSRSPESRMSALRDAFIGLHLVREEQKLDTMKSDSSASGAINLTPVLSQIARWLDWKSWVDFYDVEEASLLDTNYDSDSPLRSPIQQPFDPPAIYDWIQTCLTTRTMAPFPTLLDYILVHSSRSRQDIYDQCLHFMPRTFLFKSFFSKMKDNWSSVEFVEALASAGMDTLLLETLPESILAALQESIVECQAEPPTSWSKKLLAIVGREDVNILLTPGRRPRHTQSTLLVCYQS